MLNTPQDDPLKGCGVAVYFSVAIWLFIFALFAMWSGREGVAAILGVLTAGALGAGWRRGT